MTGPVFRFRLERVRAVRARSEKLAQRELAQAISLRADVQADVRSADGQLEQARTRQRSVVGQAEAVSATELLAMQAFIERAELQLHRHARELEQRDADVADRDAKLTTAAGEHEMLKRLRERHRGEHNSEAARRERNVLDEIALARFSRRSG